MLTLAEIREEAYYDMVEYREELEMAQRRKENRKHRRSNSCENCPWQDDIDGCQASYHQRHKCEGIIINKVLN